MEKRTLVIGIDYTDEYCQASYFNLHHMKPESVMTGAAVMRYLIPVAVCADTDNEDWVIGEEAMHMSEQTGRYLFRKLILGAVNGEMYELNGKKRSYDTLAAVYFGKLLELVRLHSGITDIEHITVTLRRVTLDVKKTIENIFGILGIDAARITVLSYTESFAYYVLGEDDSLWKDGALLFDFDTDGFFARQMSIAGTKKHPLIYVDEKNYSSEFFIKDLASEMIRNDLDRKLTGIFEAIRFSGPCCSVYFTGTGFSELWFSQTLETISAHCRVFKGNNLYVKGACLSGALKVFKDGMDYPLVCKGRTKAEICAVVRDGDTSKEIRLSRAACNWYDADGECDFILDEDKSCEIIVTSLVSRERTSLMFDLSAFPERPAKATRVQVSVHYLNDAECEIAVTDKGFGNFFAASGAKVIKRLNLEGYI